MFWRCEDVSCLMSGLGVCTSSVESSLRGSRPLVDVSSCALSVESLPRFRFAYVATLPWFGRCAVIFVLVLLLLFFLWF